MASITKRGNTYRIRVSNGRDSQGQQLFESTTFTPDPARTEKQNQKALEIFTLKFEEQVKSGKYLDGEKLTFAAFSDIWLKEYAGERLAPATLRMYRGLLRDHIIPAIGTVKLSKLQPRTLNQLYNKLLNTPKARGGTLSPASVRRVHSTISTIYSTAVRWNVCLENPCERAEPPKLQRNAGDVKYFTLEEAQLFLSILDRPMVCPRCAHNRKDDAGTVYHVEPYTELQPIQPQFKLFFYMALFLGCRRGELIALQWSDIDFQAQTVSITKSTYPAKGQLITKEPKNKTSIRTVAVPAAILTMLKEQRKAQMQEALRLGTAWEGKISPNDFKQNFIFTQWNGRQMYPSTPYAAFHKIISRYNAALPEGGTPLPLIPLHGLRHTSATLLISQNIDIRTVSGRLGHAQTSTTMNIYAHSLKKMDEAAADTLQSLLVTPLAHVDQMLTKR